MKKVLKPSLHELGTDKDKYILYFHDSIQLLAQQIDVAELYPCFGRESIEDLVHFLMLSKNNFQTKLDSYQIHLLIPEKVERKYN